jgi:hypothetical protein
MLYLLKKCSLVATDSGGLQKEAYWLNKYCVTLRNETEWTELADMGLNFVCGYDEEKIVRSINSALEKPAFNSKDRDLYGSGNASEIIAGIHDQVRAGKTGEQLMLYFVIPVYNEEMNISELAESLLKVLPDEKKFFVFVDDCSTDRTIEMINGSFPKDSVHVITKTGK